MLAESMILVHYLFGTLFPRLSTLFPRQKLLSDQRSSKTSDHALMELPFHIIIDIFSRLPIKTLVSCRCICKTFHTLLSTPDYALQCLQKTPSTILIRGSPQSYNPTVLYPHLYAVCLHEVKSDQHSERTIENLTKHKICTLPHCVDDPLQLFGSCNGLLCFYQSKSFRYSICNPLLGEYLVLPTPSPPPLQTEEYTYSHYFGFCPKYNQYKLIRFISTASRSGSAVEILTLGTKTWRCFGDISWSISPGGSFQPFLNGILHLIINGGIGTHDLTIGSFDTDKEQFAPVPPPAHFDSAYTKNVSWVHTGVYEGCLSLCYVYAEFKFEMWVMNKYGLKESWSKKFAVDYTVYQMRVVEKCYPVLFKENGEMWVMYRCLYLHKYNLKTGDVRVFDICGINDGFEAINYVPNFTSINDVISGSDFQVENLLKRPAVLTKNRNRIFGYSCF